MGQPAAQAERDRLAADDELAKLKQERDALDAKIAAREAKRPGGSAARRGGGRYPASVGHAIDRAPVPDARSRHHRTPLAYSREERAHAQRGARGGGDRPGAALA